MNNSQITVFILVGLAIAVILLLLFWHLNEKASLDNLVKNSNLDMATLQPPSDEEAGKLLNYFKQLYPLGDWKQFSTYSLWLIYQNLQCWYNPMIAEEVVEQKLPDYPMEESKTPDDIGRFAVLFDSRVCDCLRYTWPNCQQGARFREAMKCSVWPGLNVGATLSWVTRNKGLPDYAYVEVLAYPGEHGYPEVCPPNTLPSELQGYQEGTNPKLPKTSEPWWSLINRSACEKHGAQNEGDKCDFGDTVCTSLTTPDDNTQLVCLSPKILKKEGFSSRENYTSSSCGAETNCGSFPVKGGCDAVCKTSCTEFDPKTCPYVGKNSSLASVSNFWFYPIPGLGIWTNIGTTDVAYTKLGYLLAPGGNKAEGMTLKAFIEWACCNNVKMSRFNIRKQFQDLMHSKYYFKHTGENNWDRVDLERSMSSSKDFDKAYEVLADYYIYGFTGENYKNAAPFGANYYMPHKGFVGWPHGTFFIYSNLIDDHMKAMVARRGVQTLQLLREPQSNIGQGLRPAYMYEINKYYSKNKGEKTFVSDSEKISGACGLPECCDAMYMVNPMADLKNWLENGYVRYEKVGRNDVKPFDHRVMTLTPRVPNKI